MPELHSSPPHMNVLRPHRRLWVWLALVAVLATALMPSLARAWVGAQAGPGPSGWVEVCTAQGTRWVPVGQDAEPGSALAVPDVCDFCPLQAQLLPAPPARASGLLMAPMPEVPALFGLAPYRLAVWCSANPRGPPAFGLT